MERDAKRGRTAGVMGGDANPSRHQPRLHARPPDSEVRLNLTHAPERTSESKDTSNSMILVPLSTRSSQSHSRQLLCELRVQSTRQGRQLGYIIPVVWREGFVPAGAPCRKFHGTGAPPE